MKNRAIKFRAWVNNEMRYDIESLLYECLRPTISFTSRDRIHNSQEWETTDDYELMQFTGWLDKNGKEIYEGDIIKLNGHLYKIEWRGIGFWFIDSDNDCWIFDPSVYVYEVVGNIFENPELLNN